MQNPVSPIQVDRKLAQHLHCPQCGSLFLYRLYAVDYFSPLTNRAGKDLWSVEEAGLQCSQCGKVIRNFKDLKTETDLRIDKEKTSNLQ